LTPASDQANKLISVQEVDAGMVTNAIALVTGGGSGIGAAVARGLSTAGAAAVVVADVDAAAAGAVAADLPAKEAIVFGVRVNVLAPGPTDTGMAARTPDVLRQAVTGGGVRPYATPEEIADIALFLAGPGAANLVGAVLLANGGRFTV
jgi:NAD(P)-dependent dehydrogenase (short-subunit alcohol dehydrogenase family)